MRVCRFWSTESVRCDRPVGQRDPEARVPGGAAEAEDAAHQQQSDQPVRRERVEAHGYTHARNLL
eukprot:800406-Pleurochrysis_carterae.AAC.2